MVVYFEPVVPNGLDRVGDMYFNIMAQATNFYFTVTVLWTYFCGLY